MITTLDMIRDDDQHFMPLGSIPVVGPTDRINTALRFMHEQKTRGLLVRKGENEYKLILPEHIAKYPGINPVENTVEIYLKKAPLLKTIEATASFKMKESLYVGSKEFRAVGVSLHGNLIGILSRHETNKNYFYSAKSGLYKCQDGHYYSPPAPTVCVIDGYSIGPA